MSTNVTISHAFSTDLRETIEDAVAYVINEAAEQGELVSGETAWKVVSAIALAKEAQFAGLVE